MKRRNFKEWEKIFIRLTYPNFQAKEIGDYLNRTTQTITVYAHSLGITNKRQKKIKIGDIFGKLEICELLNTVKQGRIWKCKCTCGNFIETFSKQLLSERGSKSCGCGRIEAISKCVGEITGQWFSNLKRNAKSRNIKFDLTKQELSDLFIKQNGKCALSQLPIEINFGNQSIGSTASLDRIDSNKGYILYNVQFLHVDVNYMKNVFHQEYFIYICNLITENNKRFLDGDTYRKYNKESYQTRRGTFKHIELDNARKVSE